MESSMNVSAGITEELNTRLEKLCAPLQPPPAHARKQMAKARHVESQKSVIARRWNVMALDAIPESVRPAELSERLRKELRDLALECGHLAIAQRAILSAREMRVAIGKDEVREVITGDIIAARESYVARRSTVLAKRDHLDRVEKRQRTIPNKRRAALVEDLEITTTRKKIKGSKADAVLTADMDFITSSTNNHALDDDEPIEEKTNAFAVASMALHEHESVKEMTIAFARA